MNSCAVEYWNSHCVTDFEYFPAQLSYIEQLIIRHLQQHTDWRRSGSMLFFLFLRLISECSRERGIKVVPISQSYSKLIKVATIFMNQGVYRRRWMTLSFTVISCGQHLSCCVWQLDLSTELRKLTSTALLSSYRRSCSERNRTLLMSNHHNVWAEIIISSLISR